MSKNRKDDFPRIAIKGHIAFNKYGDIWMGSHSKERLQEFIKQQPWLKLEPEIYKVSSLLRDVRIIMPHSIRSKHVSALTAIPRPEKREYTKKKRNLLPLSALSKED